MGWPNYIQEIIIGVIIVLAVAADRVRRARAGRMPTSDRVGARRAQRPWCSSPEPRRSSANAVARRDVCSPGGPAEPDAPIIDLGVRAPVGTRDPPSRARIPVRLAAGARWGSRTTGASRPRDRASERGRRDAGSAERQRVHRAAPAVDVVAAHRLAREHEVEGEDAGEERDPRGAHLVQQDGAEAERRRQQVASLERVARPRAGSAARRRTSRARTGSRTRRGTTPAARAGAAARSGRRC